MSGFVWSRRWSVGLPEIDKEHEEFAEDVNALRRAIRDEVPKEKVLTLFRRIADGARAHFRHEEEILARHGYPDLKAHQQAHADLLDTLDRVGDDLAAASETAAMADPTMEIYEALVNHLVQNDLDYRWYLLDKGVARPTWED
jgi:hemerythrin-like metal-binding protein